MAFYLGATTPACDICSWNKSLAIFLFCRLGFENSEAGSIKILKALL